MNKTFTLAEAQMLLPVLESLLVRVQASTSVVLQLDKEMQELSQRIFLSGGMHVNVAQTARRRAERDRAAQAIKAVAGEIESVGVRVHDFASGMLDFPCLVNGHTVLLCWRLGESGVLHWHPDQPNSEERKPVGELFGRPERKRPN